MKVTDDAPVLPHWINGHALLAVAGSYHDITNAAGQVLRRTPLCGSHYLQQAQAAALQAQPAWQACGPADRQERLNAVADSLERYQEHLGNLLQEETPLDASAALTELHSAASAFRHPGASAATGPVLQLDAGFATPEHPLSSLATPLAAALAAGQTVAVRTDPCRPSLLLALAELCSRAGLPDGAVNVAHGKAE